MKKSKKLSFLLLSGLISFSLASTATVQAVTLNEENTTKEVMISSVAYENNFKGNDIGTTVKIEKDPLYEGMYDKNGKLQKIDKVKLKKALLERWNKDKNKNEGNIKNVDSIVNEVVSASESLQNGAIVQPLLFDSYYWIDGPTLYQSEEWIAWNNWVSENNYNSSLPISVSQTKESTAKTTIGFSGNVDLRVSLGFSIEYELSYTSSITVGTTVPAYTLWGRRPYIEYRKDYYKGLQMHKYYDLSIGGYKYVSSWQYGENDVLLNQATEYVTYTNTSHTTQTPPSLPSGQPNV